MLVTCIQNASTPLMTACQEGHTTTASLLIEKGASIDYQNKVNLLFLSVYSMCIVNYVIQSNTCSDWYKWMLKLG